jgi:hypothetical protein
LTEQGDESISHRLLQTDCNAPNDRISKTERSYALFAKPPSPLRDNDDFFFLRRDVDCFHLVLPFLSIPLTTCELRTAQVAPQEP